MPAELRFFRLTRPDDANEEKDADLREEDFASESESEEEKARLRRLGLPTRRELAIRNARPYEEFDSGSDNGVEEPKRDDSPAKERVHCTYHHCVEFFTNIYEMKTHKRDYHDYCVRCDEDCASFDDLVQHKVSSSRHITCPHCGNDYKEEDSFRMHVEKACREMQLIICPSRCRRKFNGVGSFFHHIERGQCASIKADELHHARDRKKLYYALIENQSSRDFENSEIVRKVASLAKCCGDPIPKYVMDYVNWFEKLEGPIRYENWGEGSTGPIYIDWNTYEDPLKNTVIDAPAKNDESKSRRGIDNKTSSTPKHEEENTSDLNSPNQPDEHGWTKVKFSKKQTGKKRRRNKPNKGKKSNKAKGGREPPQSQESSTNSHEGAEIPVQDNAWSNDKPWCDEDTGKNDTSSTDAWGDADTNIQDNGYGISLRDATPQMKSIVTQVRKAGKWYEDVPNPGGRRRLDLEDLKTWDPYHPRFNGEAYLCTETGEYQCGFNNCGFWTDKREELMVHLQDEKHRQTQAGRCYNCSMLFNTVGSRMLHYTNGKKSCDLRGVPILFSNTIDEHSGGFLKVMRNGPPPMEGVDDVSTSAARFNVYKQPLIEYQVVRPPRPY